MAIVPVRQLGQVGIIKDRDPYDLPPNAFSDGNNVRIVDGKIGKATGWVTEIEEADDALLSGETIRLTGGYFLEGSNTDILITDTKVLQYNGAAFADVTPTAGIPAGGDWQIEQIGNSLIINNVLSVPFVLHPGDTQFAPFANWPADLRAKQIKPYQGFLIALGVQDGGADRPYLVKWSDALDPSSNIDPSWDETDPTTLAGENPLIDSLGPLVGMEQLGSALVLYTRNGSFLMQYIGGQLVFSFRPLFRDGGLLNVNSVTEYRGRHIVVGQTTIYAHDGNQMRSISDGRWTKAFYSDLTDARSVFVYKHEPRDEVWICYTNASQVEGENLSANRCLIYNVLYDGWTPQDLPGLTRITTCPLFPDNVVTWDNIQGSWDDLSQTWNTVSPEYEDRAPLGTSSQNNRVYRMDINFTQDSANMVSFLTQDKLDLDEILSSGASGVKMINRIYPQMDGTGDIVTLQTGISFSPQTGVRWGRIKSFDIESAYKIDTRQTGRYLAIKVRSEGSGAWLLTGWDLDIRERSRR